MSRSTALLLVAVIVFLAVFWWLAWTYWNVVLSIVWRLVSA